MSKENKPNKMFSLDHAAKVCKEVCNRNAARIGPNVDYIEAIKTLFNSGYKPKKKKK